MRFVVLLFGLLAITLTAITGVSMLLWNWFLETVQPHLGEIVIPEWAYTSPTGPPHGETGALLLLAAAYGFLAIILALMRCGWQAALLFIVPVLFTAAMNPYTAAFTSVQLFTGLLSFLVFPLPVPDPNAGSGDDAKDSDDD